MAVPAGRAPDRVFPPPTGGPLFLQFLLVSSGDLPNRPIQELVEFLREDLDDVAGISGMCPEGTLPPDRLPNRANLVLRTCARDLYQENSKNRDGTLLGDRGSQ